MTVIFRRIITAENLVFSRFTMIHSANNHSLHAIKFFQNIDMIIRDPSIINQMKERKKRLCNVILFANKLTPIIILSSLRENETVVTAWAASNYNENIHKTGFQPRKHHLHREVKKSSY